MSALFSEMDESSGASVRALEFECVVDITAAQEMAERAEAAIARGVPTAILINRLNTRQWCMVYDALGKTIYATDTIREIGEVYDLEEMNVVYHDVPIPCSILILGESTHEEAEAVYGQPLSKRRHYYEVMAD
jgi:hypothetical protein